AGERPSSQRTDLYCHDADSHAAGRADTVAGGRFARGAVRSIRFESKILILQQGIGAVRNGTFPRPLVFTNGVFDILHRGHVSYLDEAAQLGASLVVAVNTDDSVRRLGKAPDRPLNGQQDRQAMLAALASVSAATVFDEDTPYELIEQLRPDVIVKDRKSVV